MAVVKVYEMGVAVYPEGTRPRGDPSLTFNIEADSLEEAHDEAMRRGEEHAAEYEQFWYPDDREPDLQVAVSFEDLTVASVAIPGIDEPGAGFCPEHGRQRSWIYRDGHRYCRECDGRLYQTIPGEQPEGAEE